MLKSILLLILVTAVSCGDASTETKETVEQKAPALSYEKNDLKKIKWIEGKWKGIYKGKPFYEMYRFSNDSTLEITSFEWDGKDTSKTSMSYVYFKDGAFYLGEKQNYKVIAIADNEIKMLPNVEANNEVLWQHRDNTGWDAILTNPKETLVYNMEYFDPFKK